MSPPSSGRRISREAELCLSPAFTFVSCLAYYSLVKNGSTYFSETSVDYQRTTRRYIPEDIVELFIITAVRTSNPTTRYSFQ
jgi:hypothetical protein